MRVSCVSHPSPVRAQQDWMCQGWSLMVLRLRYLEISAAHMQPFMSCLLARISTAALRRSYAHAKHTHTHTHTLVSDRFQSLMYMVFMDIVVVTSLASMR